jgi:hypothetical protein
LLVVQRNILEIAENTLRKKDQKHLMNQDPNITIFPVDSWVLVRFPQGRMRSIGEDKLDNFPYKGPYKVVAINGMKYELLDPATGKPVFANLAWLKQYLFNTLDPVEAAVRNKKMYLIDKVVRHRGSFKPHKKLRFLIHWKGFDSEEDTWEPWSNLRSNEVVHNYLRNHRASFLIPARYRIPTDDIPIIKVPPAKKWQRTARGRGNNSRRWHLKDL